MTALDQYGDEDICKYSSLASKMLWLDGRTARDEYDYME